MNYHANYTLFKRGKYWYYHCYSPDGIRQTAKTTHCTSKVAAKLYCDDLLVKGILYSGQAMTFEKYASGFFAEDSVWVRDRMAQGTPDNPSIGRKSLYNFDRITKTVLLPYFGSMKMCDMKPTDIKKFRLERLEAGLAPATVNVYVSTLRIIVQSAINDNIILFDPLRGIKALKKSGQSRDAFTVDEARAILSADWKREKTRLASITACVTGMRINEVLGITRDSIHDSYIDLRMQWSGKEFLPLKNRKPRIVPIPPDLRRMLLEAAESADGGRVFAPLYTAVTYRDFVSAMESAGVGNDGRGLCFHSWRHFLNTYLLSHDVPPAKVAAVMGHSSGAGRMQDIYTNWKPDDFGAVVECQKSLMRDLGF